MEKVANEQKKSKKAKTSEAPPADDILFPEEDEELANTKNLFEDSDDSDNEAEKPKSDETPADGTTQEDLFGEDSSDDEDSPGKLSKESWSNNNTTQEELFGDSSDESDEELQPSRAKRAAEESDELPQKKAKVAED